MRGQLYRAERRSALTNKEFMFRQRPSSDLLPSSHIIPDFAKPDSLREAAGAESTKVTTTKKGWNHRSTQSTRIINPDCQSRVSPLLSHQLSEEVSALRLPQLKSKVRAGAETQLAPCACLRLQSQRKKVVKTQDLIVSLSIRAKPACFSHAFTLRSMKLNVS